MADNRKLTGVGLALGAAFGTVAGVLAGHIAVWLALGIAIGVAIGASFRRNVGDCPECAMVHQEHQAREQGNRPGVKS
jgi:predicted lysophospholipase L1 biosynthesis ABC-type transport system permease subunit